MNFFGYRDFNFSFDFFQKGKTHPFYQNIFNPIIKENFKNDGFTRVKILKKNIHEIKFIPDFLHLNPTNLTKQYKLIKHKRVENFYINLEEFTSAEKYLKSQMGPKSRSQLRRRIHRLEKCFNVQYKFYFGNIDKQSYDKLFDKLEQFIKRRFIQRGDLFSQKNNLSRIRENSYQMILEKKASLFAIYADEKIIDVCLNYHFQNVVQHFIRSYDIDYSKFWVGQIDIYKQIEICFQHNFTIFDFMWGELLYKKRWSNKIATYEHHFIFKSNNSIKQAIVLLMIKLYKRHDLIKEKKFYKSIKKIKEDIFYNTLRKERLRNIEIEIIENIPSDENLEKINIDFKSYSFLRNTVYDFQYLNFDTSKNILVFRLINEKNSYIIKGAKQQIKITVS